MKMENLLNLVIQNSSFKIISEKIIDFQDELINELDRDLENHKKRIIELKADETMSYNTKNGHLIEELNVIKNNSYEIKTKIETNKKGIMTKHHFKIRKQDTEIIINEDYDDEGNVIGSHKEIKLSNKQIYIDSYENRIINNKYMYKKINRINDKETTLIKTFDHKKVIPIRSQFIDKKNGEITITDQEMKEFYKNGEVKSYIKTIRINGKETNKEKVLCPRRYKKTPDLANSSVTHEGVMLNFTFS